MLGGDCLRRLAVFLLSRRLQAKACASPNPALASQSDD
jgi:hypothetical protein